MVSFRFSKGSLTPERLITAALEALSASASSSSISTGCGLQRAGLGTALSYAQEAHGSLLDGFQARVRGKDGPGARRHGKPVGRAKETKERPGRPETGASETESGLPV